MLSSCWFGIGGVGIGAGKMGVWKAVVFRICTHGDHSTLNLFLDSFMGHDLQVKNIYEKYSRDG